MVAAAAPALAIICLLCPLIASAVDWRDGKAVETEDIHRAYHSFSDLATEVAKLQAQANAAQYSDIQIEATVIYERVFENLELLGIGEALINVTRALALEGKALTRLLLGIIDGGCRSFEDRILNTNDDLRDERFEEVPGDYIDFYERDSPIQNAYEGLIPMANTTLNFLEESTLAAVGEMDGPIVIAINGDLQRGRMLIEDSILELSRAKVFYDSAVAASMDALYAIVQQIQVPHSSGRKYYVNKLH